MSNLAIIGGTGLSQLPGFEIMRREVVSTPYGDPSGPLTHGRINGRELVFLARHGYAHTIPPHRVNYRANLWALRHVGVTRVVAIAAVGGISKRMMPGRIAFPNQIIDYTYGRDHTLYDVGLDKLEHIDFTDPYCPHCRGILIQSARDAGLDAVEEGVYAAAQGPRLETAAEINRMERDGCDLVGMTGMPETAIARELDLSYACCAVILNWAAGRGEVDIHADIETHMKDGMARVQTLLRTAVKQL